MSFKEEYLNRKDIKKVVHVGADRGGELTIYKNMGVEEVVGVAPKPEVYQEL